MSTPLALIISAHHLCPLKDGAHVGGHKQRLSLTVGGHANPYSPCWRTAWPARLLACSWLSVEATPCPGLSALRLGGQY